MIAVLGHGGSLKLLKDTGDPHALQDQISHSAAKMKLRNTKALTARGVLNINQQVEFDSCTPAYTSD